MLIVNFVFSAYRVTKYISYYEEYIILILCTLAIITSISFVLDDTVTFFKKTDVYYSDVEFGCHDL